MDRLESVLSHKPLYLLESIYWSLQLYNRIINEMKNVYIKSIFNVKDIELGIECMRYSDGNGNGFPAPALPLNSDFEGKADEWGLK